ncbi:hypothetical protein M758_8G078600 [Ceratodon purpureus]|nr:hypothetical protein M758_8G078600 [Ceratodon purpureus]
MRIRGHWKAYHGRRTPRGQLRTDPAWREPPCLLQHSVHLVEGRQQKCMPLLPEFVKLVARQHFVFWPKLSHLTQMPHEGNPQVPGYHPHTRPRLSMKTHICYY